MFYIFYKLKFSYVDCACQFYDYAFQNPRERYLKLETQENLNRLIEHELRKNETLITIINNKPPLSYDGNLSEDSENITLARITDHTYKSPLMQE